MDKEKIQYKSESNSVNLSIASCMIKCSIINIYIIIIDWIITCKNELCILLNMISYKTKNNIQENNILDFNIHNKIDTRNNPYSSFTKE